MCYRKEKGKGFIEKRRIHVLQKREGYRCHRKEKDIGVIEKRRI